MSKAKIYLRALNDYNGLLEVGRIYKGHAAPRFRGDKTGVMVYIEKKYREIFIYAHRFQTVDKNSLTKLELIIYDLTNQGREDDNQ